MDAGLVSWHNPVTTGLLYGLMSLGSGCGMLMSRFSLTSVCMNGAILVFIAVVVALKLGLLSKEQLYKIQLEDVIQTTFETMYTGSNGVIQAIHTRAVTSRAPYLMLCLFLTAELCMYIHTSGLLFLLTQYLFIPSAIRHFLGLDPDAMTTYYLSLISSTAQTYINRLPRAKSVHKED